MGSRMAFGSGRLVVKTTEDQVYETMRVEILGGMPPGTPLRLSAIADRLGVSTMPVRAALRRLEREGLVRQTARKGAIVAPLELDDIQEIQAIRWGIEGLAARVGAESVTNDDVSRMETQLEAVRASAAAHDLPGYLDATYGLKDTCFAASQRPRLVETVRHYRRAAQRYVLFVMAGPAVALETATAEAFCAAAAAHDGVRAEQAIQRQILRLYDDVAARMHDLRATPTG